VRPAFRHFRLRSTTTWRVGAGKHVMIAFAEVAPGIEQGDTARAFRNADRFSTFKILQ